MPLVETGFPSQSVGEAHKRLIGEGPTLLVNVGFDPDYNPRQGKPPRLRNQGIPALIDTGASDSCIDEELADEIGLPAVDRAQMSSAGGPGTTNVYLAQIYVPPFRLTHFGQFLGVRLTAGGQPQAVLLGRDFLRGFIMIYDGPRAQVTLMR